MHLNQTETNALKTGIMKQRMEQLEKQPNATLAQAVEQTNNVLRTRECKCHAHNASECACGAWDETPCTDDQIKAWAERHNLNLGESSDARCAFEDARSLSPDLQNQ